MALGKQSIHRLVSAVFFSEKFSIIVNRYEYGQGMSIIFSM